MTKKISLRLAVLRFPLIVGVVFIHVYAAAGTTDPSPVAQTDHVSLATTFIPRLVSQGLARLAVPLFFLMSGFLFFQGYDGSLSAYKTKLQRRVRTLLVPYLIWNALTFVAYAVRHPLPGSRNYFAAMYSPPISSFSVVAFAAAFLGVTTKYPISYQFWFIRDLIVLVILTPAIYFLCSRRRIGLVTVAVLCTLWLSGRWPLLWPADESLFFFVSGSYLAINHIDICAFDRKKLIFAVCFGILLLADAWTGDFGYLRKIMILAGLPFAWWLSEVAASAPSIRRLLVYLSGASFFVFASHEPALGLVHAVVFGRLMPHKAVFMLLLYFLVPCGLISLLVMVWAALNRVAPALLSIITGGDRREKKST